MCTWVVPAAASGGTDPPHAFKLVVAPTADLITGQRVGRQVADVKAGKLTQEVGVGHPAAGREQKRKRV